MMYGLSFLSSLFPFFLPTFFLSFEYSPLPTKLIEGPAKGLPPTLEGESVWKSQKSTFSLATPPPFHLLPTLSAGIVIEQWALGSLERSCGTEGLES